MRGSEVDYSAFQASHPASYRSSECITADCGSSNNSWIRKGRSSEPRGSVAAGSRTCFCLRSADLEVPYSGICIRRGRRDTLRLLTRCEPSETVCHLGAVRCRI